MERRSYPRLNLIIVVSLLQGSRTSEFEEQNVGVVSRIQREERGSPGYCPDGWYTFGEFCYKIGWSSLTWDSANTACASLNSNMVSVHSQEEQDFLFLLMHEIRSKVWIGLRRSSVRHDIFEWRDDSPLDYTNWFAGEPNNYRNVEGCAHMLFDCCEVGDWNDAPCNAPFKYICKKPKDPTLTKPGQDPALCPGKQGVWLKMRDSCYRNFHETESFSSWFQAQSLCKSYGGNLAYVKNPAINMLLQKDTKGLDGPFWTGIKSTKDQKYTWLGENHPLMYSNWQTDQPKESPDHDSCVALDAEGKWIVRDCQESHPFACEIGPELPEAPTVAPLDENMTCSYTSEKWHDVGGKYCYMINLNAKLKWHEALCLCKQEGGSLASIHSIEEQNVILHYMQHHDMADRPLFIGLARDRSGTFVWSDGSPYDYTNWNGRQPSDDTKQCVEMNTGTGKWNDAHCHSQTGYICSVLKVPQWQNFSDPKGEYFSGSERETTELRGNDAQLNGWIAATCLLAVLVVSIALVHFFGNSLKIKLLERFSSLKTPESNLEFQDNSRFLH